MKTISLSKGQSTIVDDDDFNRLGHMKFSAFWNRNNNSFYARHSAWVGGGKYKTTFLHRIIMDAPKGVVVDHKNHDTLDNRKENLRFCTRSQNASNRKGPTKISKSGIRGVSWYKSTSKWTAQIRVNGKDFRLGYFAKKEDAARAYAEANKKYFGEFGGMESPAARTVG